MKILDATCGMRSIWYQKNLPFVTFLDKRNEVINTLQNGNALVTRRTIRIEPDVVADWTIGVPFEDGYFDMVVFDPPHIIKKGRSKVGIFDLKYGFLSELSYKDELRKGVKELFRVLKDDGFFVLKWCETSVKLDEILKLFPYRPLFGTRTGQRNNVHWVLFLKWRSEKPFDSKLSEVK